MICFYLSSSVSLYAAFGIGSMFSLSEAGFTSQSTPLATFLFLEGTRFICNSCVGSSQTSDGVNAIVAVHCSKMLEGNPWGADVTESKWHWYVLFKLRLRGGAYKCCVTFVVHHSFPAFKLEYVLNMKETP